MRLLFLSFVLTMLAACGSDASDDRADKSAEPPTKTVFDPLLKQRDRAKEMADKLPQERKDELDRAIDSDSGSHY